MSYTVSTSSLDTEGFRKSVCIWVLPILDVFKIIQLK
eukprot:UN15548